MLSIKVNVSTITNIKLEITLWNRVLNYMLKANMRCWAPTKAHLFSIESILQSFILLEL